MSHMKWRVFNLVTLLSVAAAGFFSLGVLGWREDAGWWMSTGSNYHHPPLKLGISPRALTIIYRVPDCAAHRALVASAQNRRRGISGGAGSSPTHAHFFFPPAAST